MDNGSEEHLVDEMTMEDDPTGADNDQENEDDSADAENNQGSEHGHEEDMLELQDTTNEFANESEEHEQQDCTSNENEQNTSTNTEADSLKLKEVDVGINVYVSDHEGFFGIIKQRFSDFLVNEITEGGEVVHLTDKTVPSIPRETASVSDSSDPVPSVLTPEIQLDLKVMSNYAIKGKKGMSANGTLVIPESQTDTEENEEKDKKEEEGTADDKKEEAVTEETAETTTEDKTTPADSDNVGKTPASDNDKEPQGESSKPLKEVVITVTGLDKTERAAVHKYIKSMYKNVSANTVEKGEEKFIIVRPGLDRLTSMSQWPKEKAYTTFTLYKENIDTMEAVNIIAWRLRLRVDKLSYAGTKDRRGKTSQQISAYKVYPQNIVNATKGYNKQIHVGNFTFSKNEIALGKNGGNRFQVVIRNVNGDDEIINYAIDSLKERGFINYYGMQRFGTTSIPTYSIGCHLLKENWKDAVDLILQQRDSDTLELQRARETWCSTRNAARAYDSLGRKKHTLEGKLLQGLMKAHKNDYLAGLFNIPAKTRMLYLHSYQSYIWNCIVSKRIEKYGLKVLPGDIVRIKQETNTDTDTLQETDYIEEFTCQVFPIKTEADYTHNNDAEESNGTADTEEHTRNKYQVHTLTAEEAEKEEIYNVLLPLPGYDMIYPDNEIKEWYVELLEKDNIKLDMLKSKKKSFSLCGSYRHLIIKPKDVESRICHYNDPSLPLIPSDLDILNNTQVSENCLTEGKHKAVLLDFKLPPSTYATMALREILKMDTSPQYQSSLNSSDLDIQNKLPWQNWRHSPKKNKERGRGGNRRFSGRGGRQGRGDRGRSGGMFRGGRGWNNSPRGWGNERGCWPSRGRGSWMGNYMHGGPVRGRGSRPHLNSPGLHPNAPRWRQPDMGNWNSPPSGPGFNMWRGRGGGGPRKPFNTPDWNRGRGGSPMRGWGKGMKRHMTGDNGHNKRGRFN